MVKICTSLLICVLRNDHLKYLVVRGMKYRYNVGYSVSNLKSICHFQLEFILLLNEDDKLNLK